MEYLEGQALARLTRHAAAAPREFPLSLHLRVIVQVLEGLHYAHELRAYDGQPQALVHRDVSPQNVFVTYDGRVKLLDFGITKAASSRTETAAGLIKGKIAYMAPEQMAGARVDRRADVYAVGCMLWAAAAGRKLSKDVPDAHTVRDKLVGAVPSPKQVNPSCDTSSIASCRKRSPRIPRRGMVRRASSRRSSNVIAIKPTCSIGLAILDISCRSSSQPSAKSSRHASSNSSRCRRRISARLTSRQSRAPCRGSLARSSRSPMRHERYPGPRSPGPRPHRADGSEWAGSSQRCWESSASVSSSPRVTRRRSAGPLLGPTRS